MWESDDWRAEPNKSISGWKKTLVSRRNTSIFSAHSVISVKHCKSATTLVSPEYTQQKDKYCERSPKFICPV